MFSTSIAKIKAHLYKRHKKIKCQLTEMTLGQQPALHDAILTEKTGASIVTGSTTIAFKT